MKARRESGDLILPKHSVTGQETRSSEMEIRQAIFFRANEPFSRGNRTRMTQACRIVQGGQVRSQAKLSNRRKTQPSDEKYANSNKASCILQQTFNSIWVGLANEVKHIMLQGQLISNLFI